MQKFPIPGQLSFIAMIATSLLFSGPTASGQSYEAQQLLLDWQKLLQEKQILQDLYQEYATLSQGYGSIRDRSMDLFTLDSDYLDSLLLVSPAVLHYGKVNDIIRLQDQITDEYHLAWLRSSQDPHFTVTELAEMNDGYNAMLTACLQQINSLTAILTDGQLRASDHERITRIDAIYQALQTMFTTLRSFDNGNALLSLQRAADEQDLTFVRDLYGLED